MAITLADLKFFRSERMTDFSDGGGRMSPNEIVSGVENSVFSDVSDVDRAAGDVSIRKTYAAVTSADTAEYLDAGVVVFKAPADPAASVLAMSTGNFYDERDAIKNRLEQTITRGARWNGYLWGTHLIGQRVVVLWQRPEVELPTVGSRMELVIKISSVEITSVEITSQFVWITKVTTNLRIRTDTSGTYTINEVIMELAEALSMNFAGTEPSRYDPSEVTVNGTLVYKTRYNAESVPLFGVRPLVESAVVSDYTVKVDSLYSPLIPTSFTETALADTNPGGDSPALIAGNTGSVSFTTALQVIKPDASLFLGSGATPGSLSIVVSGATITDDNGTMKVAGSEIGTVDYGNGIIRWNSSCTNYASASKEVSFIPAARPLRVADTASQPVTVSNRGFVWVITLSPIPAPQTLRVAYRVNNVWYVLNELGGGQITGVDSSYGAGSLNFTTGTVTLTTGALPDVDSDILYSWGTPSGYTARGGSAVDAPVIRGQTANPGVAPGLTSVTWGAFTLDDSLAGDGNLTGTGGVGFIRYATGEWWVRPDTLPAHGTVFTINYDYGTPNEETFTNPTRDGSGHLVFTLAAIPRVKTLEVEWNVDVLDYSASIFTDTWLIPNPGAQKYNSIVTIRDDGSGALLIPNGTNGTVNYATKVVDWLPDVTVRVPKPIYTKENVGGMGIMGSTYFVVPLYRQIFSHLDYTDVGAVYPGTGTVTVRYRGVGGDTSATETATLNQLEFDVTREYNETIVAGSVRFTLGNSTYADTAGQLYRDSGIDTGAGTLCGTVDRDAGRIRINSWASGGANTVTLQSLVTDDSAQPIDNCVFRTPIAPIKAGTLQIRYTLLDGTVKTKTVDATGILEDSDCTITADVLLGVVRIRFGLWKVDADLSPSEKLESWYSTDARVTIGGIVKIWKSAMVYADSIIYNAVAQTFLPPDSALLGINAARLPPDGKGLIFRVGQLALIHNTQSFAASSLSPDQVLDCGRVRLYRATVTGANGVRLSPEQYTLNRELGTLTMKPTLSLTGTTSPYAIEHTVADLARIVETDINGSLTFNKQVSHAFPDTTSFVSGMLYIGTMQARVTHLFEQSTWTSVWQDTVIGSVPLAQFNDAQYPLIVTNAGAYPDRYVVKFTSATAFQVIGENLGIVGVGDTSTNCSPINTLTGVPYFTIDYRGWGSGWATGNCLRFNLISAAYPIDLIRAIQPSAPSGFDVDSVELILLGNVDA